MIEVSGRVVRELYRSAGAARSSGRSVELSLPWDGQDDSGRRVPSGTYYVRIRTAAGTTTRPVVVAR